MIHRPPPTAPPPPTLFPAPPIVGALLRRHLRRHGRQLRQVIMETLDRPRRYRPGDSLHVPALVLSSLRLADGRSDATGAVTVQVPLRLRREAEYLIDSAGGTW